MTEEATEMEADTARLGSLEGEFKVLDHRITELERRDLPHRVTNLESTTNRMAEDLHEVKSTVGAMSEKQDAEFKSLGEAVSGITNKWLGGIGVLGGLIALLTVVIAAAGLLPKFDLITVQTETPPVQVDE